MGRAVASCVEANSALTIAARFDRPDASGEGLVSQDAALGACDVVVDFTTPAASVALAKAAAARGGPGLVIGSTGLDAAQLAEIKAASASVAIVQTFNFSLDVNLGWPGWAQQVSKALGPDAYDIEVFEAHHRRKVDAPSGTALMLGEAAASGRGVSLSNAGRRARDGITGARPEGEIGFSVMRGGGIVGEHSVSFAAERRDPDIQPFGAGPQPVRPRRRGRRGLGRRQAAWTLRHAGRAGLHRTWLGPTWTS